MITMNKKGHKNQAERSSRRLWITLLFFCFTVTGFMQAANAVFAQDRKSTRLNSSHIL